MYHLWSTCGKKFLWNKTRKNLLQDSEMNKEINNEIVNFDNLEKKKISKLLVQKL